MSVFDIAFLQRMHYLAFERIAISQLWDSNDSTLMYFITCHRLLYKFEVLIEKPKRATQTRNASRSRNDLAVPQIPNRRVMVTV